MFSRALLRTGTQMALNNCKEVIRYIDARIEKDEAFDLAKVFFSFTMDTFVEIAFGAKLGSLRKPHPFATSFDVVQCLSEKRLRNPLWKMLRYVPFTSEAEIRSHVKVMDTFAYKIIHETKRIDEKGLRGRTDLITRFIEDSRKKKENPPSDQELRNIVMNFIIAGRDTTACALSWQFLHLLQDDTISKKVKDEIEIATKDVGNLEDMNHEDAFEMITKKMPYLNAVAKETLRLHPSVRSLSLSLSLSLFHFFLLSNKATNLYLNFVNDDTTYRYRRM